MEFVEGFNLVDIGVVIVCALSGLLAFARGFLKEVLSVVCWVGAALVAYFGYEYVQPYAQDLVPNQDIAKYGSIIALFLVTFGVLAVLSHAINESVNEAGLGFVNRLLGLAFGLVRGAIVVVLLFMIGQIIEPDEADYPAMVLEAKTLPYVKDGAKYLRGLAPENLREDLDPVTPEPPPTTNDGVGAPLPGGAIPGGTSPDGTGSGGTNGEGTGNQGTATPDLERQSMAPSESGQPIDHARIRPRSLL